MAIAQRGASAVPGGNPTTSFTVTVPSAVVSDDLLFLAVTNRGSTADPSVTDNDTGGNAWAKVNSGNQNLSVWWKRATSGTASKTVTVSGLTNSGAGVLKAFSGGDTGATPFSDAVIESNASGDETHAGFTPSQADSMVCAAVANYANDNAVTSLSFATLGATTAAEKLSTGGLDCGNIFGHVLQSGGPTATGNLTWAQTNGTTYSIVWAIKPLAAEPALFEASVSSAATIASAITTAIQFAAGIAGAVTVAAALTTEITCAATVTASASIAADATTEIRCAAAVSGAATAEGLLTNALPPIEMLAAVSTSATAAGILATEISLSATPGVTASATGLILTEISMLAAPSCSASAGAVLATEIPIFGSVSQAVSAVGALTSTITCEAQPQIRATTTASIQTEIALASSAVCTSTASIDSESLILTPDHLLSTYSGVADSISKSGRADFVSR